MAARRLIFDRQNPRHRTYFRHLYEGVIDGGNNLTARDARKRTSQDSDDLWDRRKDEVRLIRKLKAASAETDDQWIDPGARQHKTRDLPKIGEQTIIELEHGEYTYGLKALRASLWHAAIADEADDAMQFFEDAEKV